MNAVGGALCTGEVACEGDPANAPCCFSPCARNVPYADAFVRLLAVGLLAAALSSCTTIIVRQGQADIEVTHHFGIATVRVVPASHALLLTTQSIGAAIVADRLAIGVSRSEIALLDSHCRLVLWHPAPSNIEEALLVSEQICSIPSPGGLP